MRRCVWSRNLVNEEVMARVGPQGHKKQTIIFIIIIIIINCNWVVTRCQWLFYMYTEYGMGY